MQTACCSHCFVRPSSSKNSLENCAKPCLDFRALFFLLYKLYGSIQYGLQQQKINPTSKPKSLLGICALALLENMPSLQSSFLSQAYLEILSQSPPLLCLAHYPMHSFINLKMTFSLQSVFSPSPTLNTKTKI